jgi:hypothetical protein
MMALCATLAQTAAGGLAIGTGSDRFTDDNVTAATRKGFAGKRSA